MKISASFSVAIVLVTLFIQSCGSSRQTVGSQGDRICNNQEFLRLKSKHLDSLSVREYDRLRSYEHLCIEQQMLNDHADDLAYAISRISDTMWGIFVASVLLSVVAIVLSESK